MVQKGEHALCAKVHHTSHSPTRTRVLLHAAENSIDPTLSAHLPQKSAWILDIVLKIFLKNFLEIVIEFVLEIFLDIVLQIILGIVLQLSCI
jgi:hypothetical protein